MSENLEKNYENTQKKYVRTASYEKKCIVCGKNFTAHSEKGEYCSRSCQYQARKKRKLQEQEMENQRIAIGKLQEQKEIEHQQQILQQKKAEEQTEMFVSWCREHPILVAGALVLGGLYLNKEMKKKQRKHKKRY